MTSKEDQTQLGNIKNVINTHSQPSELRITDSSRFDARNGRQINIYHEHID